MQTRGKSDVRDNLAVGGNATFEKGLDSPYLELIDEKTSGTAGGTFTQGDWRTRDFTTTIQNDFATSITLAASPGDGAQFVIPAGQYYIEASAPGFNCDEHTARLADVTDAAGPYGSAVVVGTSEFSADTAKWRDSAAGAMTVASSGQTRSIVKGRFTVTRSTTLELQHRCNATQSADGLGSDGGFYITNNVFSILSMWQIRDDT